MYWVRCPKCTSPREFESDFDITDSEVIVHLIGRCDECSYRPFEIRRVHSPKVHELLKHSSKP